VELAWAVVVRVSVAVTGEELVTVTDEGESAQEIPGPPPGPATAQERLTVPVNPERGAIVSVAVPDCPGAGILMVVGFADTLKSVTVTVVVAEADAV